MITSELMDAKLEEFGCNYPVPHPEYCRCECCEKYIAWLKAEARKAFEDDIPKIMKGILE